MKFKKIFSLLLIVVLIINNISLVFADTPTEPELPVVFGEAYVLIDQNSGRVLISKNADVKMYPASLTKILTALIAVEYIDADELLVTGYEANEVPWDSSLAGIKPNESILFENLLRGLLIPSGNDAANVIAMEVARRESGDEFISYNDAMILFAKLMNEEAQKLGATNSHFISPHGYHDDDHYTTAYDISLIAREALKNDLIKQICSEKMFKGYGAGDKRTVDMYTQEYTWDNTNLLLGGRLASADYIYKNATGVKTGSTSEAGYCLIATATNSDEENLMSVVMKSKTPFIWSDSKNLLNYGFNNYSFVTLQEKNAIVKEAIIERPKLGESNILNLVTQDQISVLLNENEASNVTVSITVDEDKKAKNKEGTTTLEDTTLKSPISRGQSLGTISYSLDGQTLYTGNIIASNDVEERTLKSDLLYYGEVLKNVIFSWLIIPISTAVILLTVFGIRTRNILKKKREQRKRARRYRFKSKY